MTPGNAANIRDRAAPRRTVDSGLGARTAASHGGAAAAHLSCCPPRQREGACAAHRDRPRLSDKGLSLYNLDRKDEALRVCDEMVARFGTAKEPRLREVVALALSGKGFLLYILNRTDGRSASATKISPASAQRTSLNCADWWRGRCPAKGSCFANSTARTRRLLFATNFSATASERITSQSCAE